MARERSKKVLCDSIEELVDFYGQLGERGVAHRYLEEIKQRRSLTADKQIPCLQGILRLQTYKDVNFACDEARNASVNNSASHQKILQELAAQT